MKRTLSVRNLWVALLVALGACGTGTGTGIPRGPHDLILQGDASFHGPHGSQSISVAVVGFGEVLVAQGANTVSSSADPAFSFTFPGLLVDGFPYEVHYWIDSNDGGGSAGVCDAPVNDHQWSGASFSAQEDATITVDHDDANTAEVCSIFAVS